MGGRRLALGMLVGLVAACPAKPAGSPAGRPSKNAASAASGPSAASGQAAPVDAAVVQVADAALPTSPAPGAPIAAVSLAEVGLEVGSLDRTADPCVDFYQFACGGWLQATLANQIPADRGSWSRFSELDEKTFAALKAIVEASAKTPGDKLGDYYASCMDEAAIDKAGLAAVKPLLDRTQKVKDAKSWLAAAAKLHEHDIMVGWSVAAAPDFADSTKHVTVLGRGALGLPDRDYYLAADFKDLLAGYQQHVQRMLALASTAKPDVAAADVIAVETALAKVMKTATEARDVGTMYNPTDLKALGKQVKSVDWKGYFKALGVTPSARLVIAEPAYFKALDGLRKTLKPAQWASYFTYHVLVASAFALPAAYDDEAFARRKLVSGVTEKPARHKRCIESTGKALGELLGKQYVDRHFAPASKQLAASYVAATVKVMTEELGRTDWLSDKARALAQDKLAKLVQMIGYPDTWRSYDFAVKRDDFAGNLLRGQAAEVRRVLGKSGKPVDRGEWEMNTWRIDAYYSRTANNTALLAGILQPPFFGADRGLAVNMGGIGMVIGHELTHAFDDQGAQFDAVGNLKSWWDTADRAAFKKRGQCVADQYSSFEALPKQFVNGQLTLGENIADLGGVKMAFKAYRAQRANADKQYVADGFTEDQQFFLGLGQAWCTRYRPQELKKRLATDQHAPSSFRIYGALRNLPEFAAAFSCAPGTPMRPTQTCSVW